MMKQNVILLVIVFCCGHLIQGMSDGATGPQVKKHCAVILLKAARHAYQDLPGLQLKKDDPVDRLWKPNVFSTLSQNLSTLRAFFEYAQTHPDASYGDVRCKVVRTQPLPYSQENVLQCKFWTMQVEHLVKNNCTPEELNQILIEVNALKSSQLYDKI